ncbi:alpha-galactosidase A precursor [Penicillium malachiteum]|uniref:Alpha-galactosidase A n=1 Tax=Penicillium malachiteum TaxID=1324776 RepID=A0AAD6HJW5_9EURO|nr:alpha-galactosidase A precursor [Penicillium malachiteum]
MDYQPKIELLQAEIDENDQSFFRLLVNGLQRKYVTLQPGIYSVEDIGKGFKGRSSTFAYSSLTDFASVQNAWHGTSIDYLELSIGRKLRMGVYEAKCPLLDEIFVAKFARFPWEIQYIENETTAYQ